MTKSNIFCLVMTLLMTATCVIADPGPGFGDLNATADVPTGIQGASVVEGSFVYPALDTKKLGEMVQKALVVTRATRRAREYGDDALFVLERITFEPIEGHTVYEKGMFSSEFKSLVPVVVVVDIAVERFRNRSTFGVDSELATTVIFSSDGTQIGILTPDQKRTEEARKAALRMAYYSN